MLDIINFLNLALLWYFLTMSFCYCILMIAAAYTTFVEYREFKSSEAIKFVDEHYFPPVTVMIPTWNAADIVLQAIISAVKVSDYKNVFVLVINDGSTDNTLEMLIEFFDLSATNIDSAGVVPVRGKVRAQYISKALPNLTVIDKENGEKSDALNAGLNACKTPLFLTLDADSILEPDAITKLVLKMQTKPNTMAVGGAVYILNNCKYSSGKIEEVRILNTCPCAFQTPEYLLAFVIGRGGFDALGGALCYSGTMTLLDHKIVVDIGGFDYKNVAQDFEIITHLQAHKYERRLRYNISYTSSAVVWTLVPKFIVPFWRQRVKWQMGSLKTLLKYRRMLFNPRYGIIGMFTYPFYLFGETLGVLVEFVAYVLIIASWMLGILNVVWLAMVLTMCWGFVLMLSVVASAISLCTYNTYPRKKDIGWLILISILVFAGIRQFHVVSRTFASLKYAWYALCSWLSKQFNKI